MPLRTPNNSPRNYLQLFHSFIFSRLYRLSKIAGYHTHPRIESRPISPPPPQSTEFVWFVKVVCTLCIRNIPCSDYLGQNLDHLIAFDILKHITHNFSNPKLAFTFFQFTKLTLNLSHSFATYNFLLRSFSQMGYHDSVKMIFDYMKIDGYLLDNSLLALLVSFFVNAGKFDTAKELLIVQAQASSDKVGTISPFVYNNLLSMLIKRNRVFEAVNFFRDHILSSKCYCPDACTFNIVIRGLCRVGEVDKAFDFFNDMGSFDCFPDVFTYNTLANGFCRVGNVDRACELLREVQSQDNFSPDVVTYTSVISGYCKLGKMDEALNLFNEMISDGIKPNSFTFNVLIDGFGKTGNMVSALDMYERMRFLDCPPDVITFTSLIDGHCRIGHVDQGLKLWDEISARNLSPNVYTFSILINALCKENRLNEARDFLRQLKRTENIVPQPFLYNPVIDGFCKAGNVDEANVIVMEMEEKRCNPDKLTFTILILGHCMKGRMVEAISIFNKMLVVGCAPDAITITSLISCLSKAGMPNEAYKIRQTVSEQLNSGVSSSKSVPSRESMDIPVAV